MEAEIRGMVAGDAEAVTALMRAFYASPAVASDGSEEIFQSDITHCVGDCPYVEGYVFCEGAAVFGYAMVAKSFSTEFGKPCIWLEELYVAPAFRARGLGGRFLALLERTYPDAVIRLEVEAENLGAVGLYQRHGFTFLPYREMKKDLLLL